MSTKHVSKKKKGASSLTQSLVSVGVLILAIGATVLLSSASGNPYWSGFQRVMAGNYEPALQGWFVPFALMLSLAVLPLSSAGEPALGGEIDLVFVDIFSKPL